MDDQLLAKIAIGVLSLLIIAILIKHIKHKRDKDSKEGYVYTGLRYGRVDPEIYALSGGMAALSTSPFDTTYPYLTPTYYYPQSLIPARHHRRRWWRWW
jgi:hypothetical protein